MKRSTKVLIVGVEAHVVSCGPNADCSSAEKIVDAMAHGHVKLIGHGVVSGDKVQQTVDMEGKPMHFPNRAEKLVLRDVTKRHAFVKLADIAPEALKPDVSGDTWKEIRTSVLCANCGHEIPGKKRVKGNTAQKFVPDDKRAFNVGKKWYEHNCTQRVDIPPPKHKEEVAVAMTTVSFTGSIAEIKAAMRSFLGEV